ncbi:MAG: histidine phosphatase family protein [Povalibacter sp.]
MAAPDTSWPERLWLVRHGESAGNVARNAAHAARAARIDITHRDIDVPLSDLGKEQSAALARWFAQLGPDRQPQVALASPYVRAISTAQIIRDAGGLVADAPALILDERLREREFGILDRLTHLGIEQLYPEQAEIRRTLGKFYHRPPGGESWCDVILRLRSALHTISLHYAGKRLLIVTHEVVIMCFRYLLEELTEAQVLAIGAQGDVANCGVTEYVYERQDGPGAGNLKLARFNFTSPLTQENTPVTSAPDTKAQAR